MSTKIGRFEIVSELAKSPSGAVYKANDPGAGRTVALKTIRLELPPDLSHLLVQLILQEAESTKLLNSQNIALLYGAGEIEDQFCAAMEYVEGNSLTNMMARQEGFSIWDLLDISRQVCLALDHADSHGVLHRSLEPAKVMMQWDGTVKVLGFGISTMVSAMPRKGTEVPPLFYYMSPEQVRGDGMDVRSNIFSWGAILYEMVTERKAFVGENVETVRQKLLEETPEPPASINPRINLGVSRVIMQALAKAPQERYQRGQELLIDLEKAKQTTQASAAKQSAQPPRGLVAPEKAAKALAPGSSAFSVAQSTKPEATRKTFNIKPSETSAATRPFAKPAPVQSAADAQNTFEDDDADNILDASGADIFTAPKKSAAAAGWGGATRNTVTTPSPKPGQSQSAGFKAPASGIARQQGKMSAAEPPVEEPKFRFDPMMAEPAPNAPKALSFSDLDELPPLKDVDVAPLPPPTPALDLEEHLAAAPVFSTLPAKEEKPRIITRENARNAVNKIKKVPPALMLYSIAAAAVIILATIIGIALYIHHQNADDDTSTASAPATEALVQQPAQSRFQAPAPAREEGQSPEVLIKPHYAKQHRAARAPVVPLIIPGQLALDSTPEGAQIQIDSRSDPSWVTPYTVTGLNPGEHTAGITKAGYASETRTLAITSGSKSFLAIHLTQLGAGVSITSEPAGANVYIDGKDTGRVTPVQITAEKGTHTFLVRKQGYLDETTTSDLAPGQSFHFSPILKALGVTDDIKTVGKFKKLFGRESSAGMAKVSVKTQPKGAQVTVNRRMVDKPTPVDFLLNPGNYIIDITLSGYKPIHHVINVEQGGKLELNQNMEPQ